MPDLTKELWAALMPILREQALPIVLIILVALVLARAAQLFIRGIVKALMNREATEGTAQELSAVEVAKRTTLDPVGSS